MRAADHQQIPALLLLQAVLLLLVEQLGVDGLAEQIEEAEGDVVSRRQVSDTDVVEDEIIEEQQDRPMTPQLVEHIGQILEQPLPVTAIPLKFLQPSLHAYLFTNSLQKDSEYIEYLAQLFKTILMKLNEPKLSINLIQLFYNTKYHNFPIFPHCALLATSSNELVKVTAQQCILLLIALCNRKELLNNFLGELPMFYMLLRLVQEF